jgi:hypothetical protein
MIDESAHAPGSADHAIRWTPAGARDQHHRMAARISHTSVDARDAYAQSVFWAAVLADPEGNEFCILRSDAERATGT